MLPLPRPPGRGRRRRWPSLAGTRDGQERARLHLGRGWVDRLAPASGDGTTLAASVGRSVCLVSPDGALRGRFDGHPSTVTGLAWHAERGVLITASYGVLSLLSPDGGDPVGQKFFRTSLLTVSPSPDGRFVASGTQDPLVHVWDLEDERNEVNLTGYPGKIAVLAWSPAQPLLATAAGPGLVIWDFDGGRSPPASCPAAALARRRRAGDGAWRFLWSGELLAGTEGRPPLGHRSSTPTDGDPRRARRPGAGRPARCAAWCPRADGRSVVVLVGAGGPRAPRPSRLA